MQGTTDVHHQIADTLLPQPDPVFDEATALDTAVHMLDPQPAVGECLIRHVLLSRQLLAAWFLGGVPPSTHGVLHRAARFTMPTVIGALHDGKPSLPSEAA